MGSFWVFYGYFVGVLWVVYGCSIVFYRYFVGILLEVYGIVESSNVMGYCHQQSDTGCI